MKNNKEPGIWTDKHFEKHVTYCKNPDQQRKENTELDFEEFKTAYSLYLKYFVTPDVIKNRYHGALIQIDQYLTSKNIPAIHCIFEECIPSWFKFTSGIVDTELAVPGNYKGPFVCSNQHTVNSVTPDGNKYIFNKLVHYIENDIRRI
jgi:hypothetical protein